MSQATTSNRNTYYNPVTKIQSLIHNIDTELVQLCKQCSVPKPVIPSYYKDYKGTGVSGTHLQYQDRIKAVLSRVRSPSVARPLEAPDALPPDVHKRQMRNIYRSRVIDAYRNRRIFTVYGNYHTVRRALLRRGWLEKLPPSRLAKLQSMTEDQLLDLARRGNEYEAVILSKMINHFPAFFIWQGKAQRDQYAEVLPYRNRVRRSHVLDFSTKVGLVGCAEQERWFREDGICGMSHPRFYRLGSTGVEDRMAFIEDFQHTQARSLLRYIAEHRPTELIDPENGTVLSTTLDFALGKVKKMIRNSEHYSLDDARIKPPTPVEMVENQTFMLQSTDILKSRAKFKLSEKVMKEYAQLAEDYLREIESIRPDYAWDGCRNLWILKPGYQSRGLGIVIRGSLDELLQWSSNNQNKRYIVQKYIERPLLVYRTKFDIRQYMLLTISQSQVSVWTYKDCYLRFSSQEFTMDDLRESIHLTNNSVQKRYKNKTTRDPRLPKNNMWSMEQFKCYLRQTGAPETTWNKIYNGFKQNLIAIVMASIDETDLVPNAFELYGCDFMLDEQYNPILIEINSTPDVSPSTDVTARICPLALKDCIRVIVDLPKNPMAHTGLFERIFELSYDNTKTLDPKEPLELNGKQMTLCEVKDKANTRTRFLRKILSNVKIVKNIRKFGGKEDIPPVTTTKARSPTVKIKKKKTNKSGTVSKPSSRAASVHVIATVGNQKRILPSAARHNLALQYTAPR